MAYKYVAIDKRLSRRKSGFSEREHVLIMTQILGRPLQGSEQVHHIDGNPLNNDPSNLILCPDMKTHKMLHARSDALKASGHEHFMKCAYCKGYDDPINMYIRKNSYQAWHRECAAKYKRVPNPQTGPYKYGKRDDTE